VELYVLATEALIAKGVLEGTRPDPRAVAVLRDPESSPKKPPTVVTTFDLLAWTRDPIWLAGSPFGIPVWTDKERVVVLRDATQPQVVPVEPSFPALRPAIEVVAEIPKAAVAKM